MSERRNRSERKADIGEFPTSDQAPMTGFWSGPGFINEKVEYVVINGRAIAEGDICLGTADELKKSNDTTVLLEKAKSEKMREAEEMSKMRFAAGVIVGQQYRWPNCTMPYEIDPNLPNPTRVTDAMKHWTDKTGFKFVNRTTENDYVRFIDGGGCWSYVGRQGGKQELSIGSGCSIGNTIHEIGHAIGYFHEQSRNDRNNYVTINWQHIAPASQHNFSQYLNSGQDVGSYDYCSMMHYPRNAFSIDGQDTITPLNPGAAACMGQRTGLSASDIAAMGTLYPGCAQDPCLRFKEAALRCRRLGNLLCYYLNLIAYFLCRYRSTRDARYLRLYRTYRTLYGRPEPVPIEPVTPPEEEALEEEMEIPTEEEMELKPEEEMELPLEEEMELQPEEGILREPVSGVLPEPERCLEYREQATRYLLEYRRTQIRRYLCYYYRFLAIFYLCRYRYTQDRRNYELYRLYWSRYRQCIMRVT